MKFLLVVKQGLKSPFGFSESSNQPGVQRWWSKEGWELLSQGLSIHFSHHYFCHFSCIQPSPSPSLPVRRDYPTVCAIIPNIRLQRHGNKLNSRSVMREEVGCHEELAVTEVFLSRIKHFCPSQQSSKPCDLVCLKYTEGLTVYNYAHNLKYNRCCSGKELNIFYL